MWKDDFPQIWVPGWDNRELRQLLWHRHRMVQARTRIMNQLQAVAINEGVRYKKRLWREAGRKQLESLPLAPWASRRRQDLLEVLDRVNPTIAELTQAIEQEVEKCGADPILQSKTPSFAQFFLQKCRLGPGRPRLYIQRAAPWCEWSDKP